MLFERRNVRYSPARELFSKFEQEFISPTNIKALHKAVLAECKRRKYVDPVIDDATIYLAANHHIDDYLRNPLLFDPLSDGAMSRKLELANRIFAPRFVDRYLSPFQRAHEANQEALAFALKPPSRPLVPRTRRSDIRRDLPASQRSRLAMSKSVAGRWSSLM